MKKPIVSILLLFLLVLIALVPAVTAGQEYFIIGNATDTKQDLQAIPEMDMTGLHTDIELIEVDPEIESATDDWIVLAHDEAGKELLLDDIDGSDLTAAEKVTLKKSVRELWDTYPTKFEYGGQKSIGIVVQSDGSKRTVSVPVGYVTRIAFDKDRIRKSARDTNDERLMKADQTDEPSVIVLSAAENQTVKNITRLRAKKIRAASAKTSEPSSSGIPYTSSNPGNSFNSGQSPFSSSFSHDSGFSSSTNIGRTVGSRLMAWSGGYIPPSDPSDPPITSGHNSFAYWGASYLVYSKRDVAAIAGLVPDDWTSVPDPTHDQFPPNGIINGIMHSIGHYYNPNPSEPIHEIVEGQAPDEFQLYAGNAKTGYNYCISNPCTDGDYVYLAQQFGYATHFLTDVGNPLHTGREIDQARDKLLGPIDTHAKYEEDYVQEYWQKTTSSGNYGNFGSIVKDNSYYYPMTDTRQSIINLATFSHTYTDTLYYRIRNNPDNFQYDPIINRITENCIRASARYTMGFAYYCRNVNTGNQRPTADFKYEILSRDGNSANIRFTSTSTGATSYSWIFPDGLPGSTSSEVTRYFTSGGMKTVVLTVLNQYGDDVKTMDVPVAREAPQASFYIVPQDYPKIKFISTSVGINPESAPTKWYWDFGDSSTSPNENSPEIVHSYPAYSPIPYKANLVAKNIYGNSIAYLDVNVPTPAVAGYIYTQIEKTVQFTDRSTNVSAWLWNFGDGATSTVQNPTHIYSQAGTYTVQLKIQDAYYTDQPLMNQQITITNSTPTPSFTATPTSGPAPLVVQFTDTSIGSPANWNWSFGDNSWVNTTNPAQKSPSHIFATTGTYTVTLYVSNALGGSSTSTQITVVDAPPLPYSDPIEFTIPGTSTYTVPAGIQSLNVTVMGAGGGGGGGNYYPLVSTGNGGDGGYAGQTIENRTISVSPGSSIQVVVGTKGSGGAGGWGPLAGSAGTAGTTSSAGAISASGGAGGAGGQPSLTSSSEGRPGQNGFGTGKYAQDGSTGLTLGGIGGAGRGAGGGGGGGGTEPAGSGADGYVRIQPLTPRKPVANFSADVTSGSAPLNVQFVDTSTNIPTSWIWDFGDGNTTGNTVQNPTHSYQSAGIYNVSLNAANLGGSAAITKSRYITVTTPIILPPVTFTATPVSGSAPLTVRFTDTTTGSPTIWNWSFGDGSWFNTTKSTQKSPTHIYATNGTFNARLIACNAAGCNITTPVKTITVTVLTPPLVKFSANATSGYSPLSVKFTDSSTGSPATWNWSFGDGFWFNTTTATQKSPAHTYTTNGTFNARLIACNAAGCNTTAPVKTITVNLLTPPVVKFATNRTSGTPPLTVFFSDQSTGVTKWNWSFGDGSWFNTTKSTQKSPTHVYTTNGTFNARLIACNAAGCNTTAPVKTITVN